MSVMDEIFSEYMQMRRNGLDTREALRALRTYIEPLPQTDKETLAQHLRNWEKERTIPTPKKTPPPKPKPPPLPQVRDAKPSDAGRLSKLFSYLGHPIEEKALKKNLSALRKTGELPLVATLDKQVVGVCGVNRRVAVHRSAPLGRISVLVVAEEAQGRGIGRMLVETAEAWFRKQGCTLVEVTSNDRRTQAHAFYRHMGYERTSIRFAKTL